MVGIGCVQYVLERGESEDWFNSRSIQILSALALFGLAGFIWRELKVKHPAVDLHVLKNRNLAFTTIFTFVTGLGLFTSVFVYPVLAQRDAHVECDRLNEGLRRTIGRVHDLVVEPE